jgi:hypothetical protein
MLYARRYGIVKIVHVLGQVGTVMAEDVGPQAP